MDQGAGGGPPLLTPDGRARACSGVVIRRARPADSSELTRIAHASKRHWGYPDEWLELWRESLTVDPAYLETREAWVALVDGTPAGFTAIARHDDRWELEHLWVLPERMGQGLGRCLLAHAAAGAREAGATYLLIVSDPYAEPFYLRMGAIRVGEEASLPTGRRLPVLTLDLGSGGPASHAQGAP